MIGPRITRLGEALLLLVLALSILSGCAAPYTVRTAGRGKTAIHASLGGPLVGNLGGAIPVPAAVLTGRYGLTDDWDIHGSFHLTAAVFRTGGIDLGVTRRLVRERGAIPEITAALRVTMFGNFESLRVYPELEAYASYLIRKRVLLYLGLTTLYDFFWPRDSGVRVHFGPVLGTEVRLRGRHALSVALRWISPQADTRDLVVDYVAPFGMLFVQIGYQANLGGF